MTNAAVFLDKDGTLIDDVPYNVDPARITLSSGAADGVRLLHAVGYRLIVISNQSGVARGLFAYGALAAVTARLRALLAEAGVPLAGVYYCPHHPEGCVPAYAHPCDCRKPAPGLILRAAAEHQIDLRRSWFVGDILHDVEAGWRAGCHTALLNNGHETEWLPGPGRTPDLTAPDLAAAARAIIATNLTPRPPSLRGKGVPRRLLCRTANRLSLSNVTNGPPTPRRGTPFPRREGGRGG